MLSLFRSCLLISAMLLVAAKAIDPDTNDSCSMWAESGECTNNPDYMLTHCATSCDKIAQEAARAEQEVASVETFFALSANDIDGNPISFEKYRGQVTILTNVASYCGYTDSHYKSLVELWSHVSSEPVNILAFPCNQFGQQEPGSAQEIKDFASAKGVKFTMMEKIDVNGPEASLVYKYLKRKTGVDMIKWNFATYFVVGPDGSISQHSGVEPMELKAFALGLLKEEL